MERQPLDALVREDLERIPRGDLEQNILRSLYNMRRRHDISVDPHISKSQSLESAIAAVKKDSPCFTAEYDASYFSRGDE